MLKALHCAILALVLTLAVNGHAFAGGLLPGVGADIGITPTSLGGDIGTGIGTPLGTITGDISGLLTPGGLMTGWQICLPIIGCIGEGMIGLAACGMNPTIGGVLCNVLMSLNSVPGLLSGFAYLIGLVLGAMGIAKLYEHVQNPNQTPIWDSLKRFLAGGAMFALPMVMGAASIMLTGGGDGFTDYGATGLSGTPSGGGLDAMMSRLMMDTLVPALNLFSGFGYLAGTVLTMVAIMRLIKSAQDGPRGPSGLGTIMTIITAGALFSLDTMMGAWSSSLFNSSVIVTNAQLTYSAGLDPMAREHVQSVISAVIAFMMILGWVSFIRGWFIIRDVAEGNSQASLMAGMTHLFGGALAVNLGPVMNTVQASLGLTGYGVTFGF